MASLRRNQDPFDIVEHRVREFTEEEYLDDLHASEEDTIEQIRAKERRFEPPKRKGKNKYGWAFFLFSMFTGLGITATIDSPLPLFLGLGIGFLFFVDPIYEALMRRINNL